MLHHQFLLNSLKHRIQDTPCVLVLVGAANLFAQWKPGVGLLKAGPIMEAGTFVMYTMYVLAFPSGFLWSYVFHQVIQPLLGHLYAYPVPVQAVLLFTYYIGYVTIGYFQWFVLLPWLFRGPDRVPANHAVERDVRKRGARSSQ